MATLKYVRRSRLVAIVVISALIGIVAALVNGGQLRLGVPPTLGHGDLDTSVAVTHVMVDVPGPGPSLFQKRSLPQHLQGMIKHTELLGQALVSRNVLDRIAPLAGVAPDELSGLARTTANIPLTLSEPVSARRASDIRDSEAPYRIEVEGRPTSPVLDIYAQAPSPGQAEELANAAVGGLQQYVDALAAQRGRPSSRYIRLRQLGLARGAVANGGTPKIIAMLTFLTAFGISCAVLLAGLLAYERRRLRALIELDEAQESPEPADDNWPRTSRGLPWMLAAFLALLWLVPFNTTSLNVSAPIELRLDRLILPFIIGLWILAVAAGGRTAPRLRWSRVHLALCVFTAVGFVSVVLNARYLNHSLEIDLAIKKLPLLVSYVLLFMVVASAVRRAEVNAFLSYTLVLAVITALGMIIEYRFKQNLFYAWTDKLLPGFFTVDGQLDAGAVDDIGRRLVRGPTEAPLEAVTMLTMALPIALARLMAPSTAAKKLLYAAAVCVIVAATFATYRKSALLAPVSVILTLAYFRRRELLKLAPLGLVLLVLVSVVSPGAIGSTISQFTRPDAADVPTVSDRASDYDAVRPDVFSHIAFGRGLGTYNHVDYRILDSEVLHTTIETGLIGLLAYLLIPASVLLSVRKLIRRREDQWSSVALIGAACAVAFLVVSFLFDVMSFPHAGYIFLYIAALVTVGLKPSPAQEAVAFEPDDDVEAPARHERETPPPYGVADGRRSVTPPVTVER
ncbi:MAG TPA: hypothetical protein VFY45_09810 [Baekduia sp.]|nr:hypothetical protein [Baekduia sp.]